MSIFVSNMLATSAWMAFLSVLAIIGIIVAGGIIVALLGRMVLSIISPRQQEEVRKVDEFGYVNNAQGGYIMQSDEVLQNNVNVQPQQEKANVTEDYAYGVDVDHNLAKIEEDELNSQLNKEEDDDFFKDFVGDDDVRFGDDDLMGMIDEISQDVLDEEEKTIMQTEQEESEANQSMLDKYSIDSYLNEEIEDDIPEYEEDEVYEQDTEIVDEQTSDEINTLKQQVKEIVESMQDYRNQNETFNEQLINILNELKEANKKEVRTVEDAEREINDLKQQLEDSRVEMEQQLQERIADKDAEMQERLQQQLEESNAEIESLKAQLNELLNKMDETDEEPEDEEMEVEPVEEVVEEKDEISALRQEVKEMLETMREENDAKTNEFNTQLLEILNEMKQATLNQAEQLKVETNDDAVETVEDWETELELAEKEIEEQFKEEMLHKDDEEKAELRAQMDTYNQEISELKEQLAFLKQQFDTESENAKNENQALLDQLEAERQQRIKLEQEKLEIEKEQQEQLEILRKENEELIDRIQTKEATYDTLTQEEMEDLYSDATTIDYSAISKMNEEQIEQKVKEELQSSKQDIDELKEQVSRLTNYIKEYENSMADKMNVHEVRSADFDINEIKEITTKEVEDKVEEKIIESLAEIEILKDELNQTKQEIENQYKDQLANKDAGMEYDRVSKLQESAEKIDSLNEKLEQVSLNLKDEKDNIQSTTEECVAELENAREVKSEQAKLEDSEVSVIGPKNNKVALVAKDEVQTEEIKDIDIETVKELTEAEIDEIVASRLESSNNEIEKLKQEIAELKKDLDEKNEQIEKAQETSVPVVRSPLFDVEMIKNITAQEVEKKVQERLAEAMKEIESMKAQLELSKQEIEKQYKEEIANNNSSESEVKDKLKGSAAEVIELKEQLIDLTEQIAQEHQEAKQNSEVIAEQLGQDRKEKQEIAMQQLAITEQSSIESAEVTVIGPKNNQVALITGVTMLTEEVGEMNNDIPTIDIETVKQLTEQEIEEKVQLRMASSIIEIEELKKQILNLSIQIQEIKGEPTEDDDEKPMVFHYATEEAYLERLAVLEERLKSAKKDLKINNKELNPLEKVKRTLERDKLKLRRKYAIVAKKKVALYGVNNYVDIDKDKAEKLAQELELLEGLKLSVGHCEEVMNANVDRYPILVHTDKILKENIANIESDIETLNKELKALREKNEND